MGRIYISPFVEKQVLAYCEVNGITDINAFANRCALQGLSILKYGVSPMDNINRENKGIKDVKKNELIKNEENKKDVVREDVGKQVEAKREEGGEVKEKEEEPINVEEIKKTEEVKADLEPKKEVTRIKKIRVIKKQ